MKKIRLHGLQGRSLSLRLDPGGRPSTIDDQARSVSVVCATEQPVQVLDWERWEMVDEVLLMSGAVVPETRQVPLLDSHMRGSTASVFGSVRELTVSGAELIGRAYFAADPGVESTWGKVRDGHITDFSVGYRIETDGAVWVPAGQSAVIEGRTFAGPVRVVTRWRVKELSVCPIGADDKAKARAAAIEPLAGLIPEPQRKETAMDKRLRAFLERRGLATDATEEQAWEFLSRMEAEEQEGAGTGGQAAAGQRQEQQPAPDMNAAIAAERARVAEITALGRRFDCPDLVTALVADGKSVDEARAAVLEAVDTRRRDQPPPEVGFRVASVGVDEREKFRDAAVHAICLRGAVPVASPAPGSGELAGFSMRELARHALMLSGQPMNGGPMEMLGRALTSTDLPVILGNAANTSLFAGFAAAEETWSTWCGTGSAPDFKEQTLAMLSEGDDLDEISESQPYRYGAVSDAKETYRVVTYGKLFAITRQAMINDEIGALTAIPMARGMDAARKVGDLPYAVLTANSAMRDNVALFHAGHGNLGTAGAPSSDTIAQAIKLMKLQKDIGGKRRINIRAQFFIAPVTLEGAAEVFFNSTQFAGTSEAATRVNPYAGTRFTRVYEPRLDDSSATAYYLAGPQGQTVTVFFLGGQQTPYLETKTGWTVDGIEYKVRIDAGAKAVDWRGMVKNAG